MKNKAEKSMRWCAGMLPALFGMLFLVVPQQLRAAAVSVYISPDGSDRNNGRALYASAEKKGVGPVRSLERARDIARSIRLKSPDLAVPLQIVLAPGIYRRSSPFVLKAVDSGSVASPTIYKAAIAGKTIIMGSITLPQREWGMCKHIPACELKQGVMFYSLNAEMAEKSGHLFEDGLGSSPGIGRSELYFNGQKMPLSRWPDKGFALVSALAEPGEFSFSAQQPLPLGLDTDASLWVRGYWGRDWADYAKKVKKISASDAQVELESGKLPYPIAPQNRFFMFNGVSLIDAPGEWAFDERTGDLHFLPPSSGGTVEWSVSKGLLLADNLSNVVFDGISFERARGDIAVLRSSRNVVVKNCRINGASGWGAIISGTYSGISNCDVSNTGLGGVQIAGGDRKTLQSSGLFVERSRIHLFSQRVRTYQPAVVVTGVGGTVRYNEISDAPHSAIILSGNDHLVEGNEIHHVMKEVSDGGAIYMGRDWTSRGIVIRNNYLHDIKPEDDRMVMGIYLDDQASGVTVSGNVFWSVSYAVFVGGGSDNKVFGNVFVRSAPAIYLDDRGLTWQRQATLDPNAELQTRLSSFPYKDSAIWRSRYPELVGIKEDGFGVPKRNIFEENAFVDSKAYDIRTSNSVLPYQRIDQGRGQFLTGVDVPSEAPASSSLCKTLQGIRPSLALCTEKRP